MIGFLNKNAILLAAIAGGVVMFMLYDSSRVERGKQIVVEESRKKAAAANERNAKIREKVKEPGAAERLLRHSCRDCD